MKLKNVFFFLKKFKKKLGSDTFAIVSCSIRDPSPRDFSLMTLSKTVLQCNRTKADVLALVLHAPQSIRRKPLTVSNTLLDYKDVFQYRYFVGQQSRKY